ncbi:hypothetical protein HPB48_023619 [Haemaphysalis longicornis]|uniref:Uncharacterized protein n=1 Tax=Haemaphysalis longicornis TaxID=44386 RepID=A0A9J6H5I4_HAELO|nr:hypothetical protein HPB48_023619 [Haemaphysalis longicornis]
MSQPLVRARPQPLFTAASLAQSRCSTIPASGPQPDRPQPSEPILFPRLRIRFADFPLPTLVYRLEAVHLGDLLRMWVRSGTKITLPHSDFQGPTGALRTAQEPHCSTEPPSLSRGEPIPGTRSPYREKKTLPAAPIGVSELLCVAALGPEGPISVAGFGTVNPISFWLQRGGGI